MSPGENRNAAPWEREAREARALASLARALLESSGIGPVAELAVVTVAEVTDSPRVALVDLRPDGSPALRAHSGLSAADQEALRSARPTADQVRSLGSVRRRLFTGSEDWDAPGQPAPPLGAEGSVGPHAVFPFPTIRNGVLSALAIDLEGVDVSTFGFVEAVVDLLEVAQGRAALHDDLQSSESRWRTMVEESPDGIVELDRTGRIVLANPAFALLVGRTADQLRGLVLQTVIDVKPEGNSGELEARVSTTQGERVLEVRLTPQGEGFLATVRDVTSARLISRRQHAFTQVARSSEVSPGLLFGRLVRAVEDERARMAVEVHDGPVQSLTGLTLRVDTVRDLVSNGRVDHAETVLLAIRRQLADEVASLRQFMIDLRPPALDRFGLREALRQHGERFFAETGVAVRVGGEGASRLPAPYELVIFRIVQEALVNVAKHAQAREVVVNLDIDLKRQSLLEIRDDGIGFSPTRADDRIAGHFGLVAMRERAEMIGAFFELDSQPGHGTCLRMRFGVEHRKPGVLAG